MSVDSEQLAVVVSFLERTLGPGNVPPWPATPDNVARLFAVAQRAAALTKLAVEERNDARIRYVPSPVAGTRVFFVFFCFLFFCRSSLVLFSFSFRAMMQREELVSVRCFALLCPSLFSSAFPLVSLSSLILSGPRSMPSRHGVCGPCSRRPE